MKCISWQGGIKLLLFFSIVSAYDIWAKGRGTAEKGENMNKRRERMRFRTKGQSEFYRYREIWDFLWVLLHPAVEKMMSRLNIRETELGRENIPGRRENVPANGQRSVSLSSLKMSTRDILREQRENEEAITNATKKIR